MKSKIQSGVEKHFGSSLACRLQWEYPVINLGRNEFRNCCRTEPTMIGFDARNTLSPELIQNSYTERYRRAELLLGEKNKACSVCWALEDKKLWSPRESYSPLKNISDSAAVEMFEKLDQLEALEEKARFLSEHGVTYTPKTNMLEIVLKNTCDMQCMYCSHHYSSRWAQEKIKYNEIDPQFMHTELPKPISEFKKVFLEWFKTEGAFTIDCVNFLGGEPSLIPEFYEISEEIALILRSIGRQNVNMMVVTNLNGQPAVFDKFTNHLRKISQDFHVIDINVSIEAFGKRAEYIRYGLNWDRWQRNFAMLFESVNSQLVVSLQMATNILSITSLPQLLRYAWSFFEKTNKPVFLRQNMVTFPSAHSPALLTADFVKYLDESIQFVNEKQALIDSIVHYDYGKWQSYGKFLTQIRNSIIHHTELSQQEKLLVQEFFNTFNKRRKIDMYEVFPEYSKFLLACGIRTSGQMFWVDSWKDQLYRKLRGWASVRSQLYVKRRMANAHIRLFVRDRIGWFGKVAWHLFLSDQRTLTIKQFAMKITQDPKFLYRGVKVLAWHVKEYIKSHFKRLNIVIKIIKDPKLLYYHFKVFGWHVKQHIFRIIRFFKMKKNSL